MQTLRSYIVSHPAPLMFAGGSACACLPYAQASTYAVRCSCRGNWLSQLALESLSNLVGMRCAGTYFGSTYESFGALQAFVTEFMRTLATQMEPEDTLGSDAGDLTRLACCITAGVIRLLRAPYHPEVEEPHMLCRLVRLSCMTHLGSRHPAAEPHLP